MSAYSPFQSFRLDDVVLSKPKEHIRQHEHKPAEGNEGGTNIIPCLELLNDRSC